MAEPIPENQEGIKESMAETPEQKRAELALDVQDQKPKTLADFIEAIDPEVPLEEQKPAMKKIKSVVEPLLFKAFLAGEKEEDLRKSPLAIQKYSKSPLEKTATKKWGEIYENQAQIAQEWWERWIEEAKDNAKTTEKEKKEIEKREKPKETQWMASSVKFGLIAAGAIGAWELYRYITDPAKRKTSDLILGTALTTMGVGALLAPETLGKWSAIYMDLNISDKAIGDFWDNIKKREFKKAFAALDFDSECPGISQVAERLDISKKTVIEMKDFTWESLDTFHNSAERKAKSLVYDGLRAMGMGNAPGISVDDEAKVAQEEEKVMAFIKENKDEIDSDIEKMTVGEILAELSKKGVFGEKTEKEKHDAGKEDTAQTEAEKKLKESDMPHVMAGVEMVKKGEVTDGLLQILSGAVEDKAGVTVKNGLTFLVKGSVIVPMSSIGIIGGQIQDLASAVQGEGEYKDLIWEDNQEWWFGTYAAYYAGKAALQGKTGFQVLTEGGKGGLKGILDSYILLPRTAFKGYKMLKEIATDANYLKFRQAEFSALSPEAQIHVLHKETAFYAERYLEYMEKAELGRSTKIVSKSRGKFYEMLFGKGWDERMAVKAGKKYFEAYQKYLERTKATDTTIRDVSLEGIEKESSIRAKLKDSAKNFTIKNPESALPAVPKYLTQDPKFGSHAEATKAGVEKLKLDSNLIDRMKKLGLDHERVSLRLREAGVTKKADLEKLCADLEASKNPNLAARTFEMKLFAIRNPKTFAAYQGIKKAAGVLAVVYMAYDFEQSHDKWNTLGSDVLAFGSFEAGFAGAQYLPIPNPILKEVAAVGVGALSACGGAYVWDTFAKPQLEKYFPNRNEIFKSKVAGGVGTYLKISLGGAVFGSIGYAADAMGIGDGIDEETDPLEYVQETSYTWHPDYVGEVFEGERIVPYDDHRNHDLADLRANAQEAKTDLEGKKKDLEASIKAIDTKLASPDLSASMEEDYKIAKEEKEQRLAAIESAILRYDTYIDDSWVDIKKMELVFIQANMLEPVYEKFGYLVQGKFGEEGLTAYARLMARLQKGEMEVKGENEMQVWQFLCDEKASVEGGEVSFIDFTSMTILNYNNMKFLEKIEKEKAPHGEETKPGKTGEESLNT